MDETRTNPLPQLVRSREVIEATGLSRTQLWRLVRSGDFPNPIRVGKQAVAWRIADVEAWIDSRPAA